MGITIYYKMEMMNLEIIQHGSLSKIVNLFNINNTLQKKKLYEDLQYLVFNFIIDHHFIF